MRWRLTLTPPMYGADNMALDEALLDRARRTGEGVVRVYSWASPTLSLGRNQRARGRYSAERASALGVDVVRRATGGRALLHHREITYSVTAPADPAVSLARAYGAINVALVEALLRLGVSVEIAPAAGRMGPPDSAPCFERPAPGELTLGGRKLVGSAQYRERGALLQHGSILVRDDQALVARLADQALGEVVPAATLAEALHREPPPLEFADALFAVVRERWDSRATPLADDPALRAETVRARRRYASDEWTWRR